MDNKINIGGFIGMLIGAFIGALPPLYWWETVGHLHPLNSLAWGIPINEFAWPGAVLGAIYGACIGNSRKKQ